MRGSDEEKVSAWLAENVAGVSAPFTFELIAGGRSNLTFRATDADGVELVVRRPPLGHVLATAHDMGREHRIISAVGTTDVPVPKALALCTDESVNEAPFYVMGFVAGVVLDAPDKAAAVDRDVRRTAGFNLIDVLARLHAVDVDAIGLGDLARRDSYVERQLKRWSTQWANSKTRELPVIDEVERRLRERIPEQVGTAIAHGDYRFGNTLVDTAHRRITAVLDWELCTLGDPLADVGYLGVYWSDEGKPPSRFNDPTRRGRVPRLRRAARPLRRADRAGPLGHRVLPGLRGVPPRRHRRGCLRPVPPWGDGRRRRRPGIDEERRRRAGGNGTGVLAPSVTRPSARPSGP